MKRTVIFASLMLLLLGLPETASARLVVFGKARETIPVAFGVESLFRFPMEVKTVTEASRFEIKPSNSDDPDYSVLAVKPRMSEGAADVTFILSDGSVIRTQLLISNRPNLRKDSIYDFKPKDDLVSANPNLAEKHDPMVISELDLMRAMIRGENVAGFDLSHRSQSIGVGSPHLAATLVKVYSGKDVNGYVYILKTDTSDRAFEIDLKGLAIGQPNLAVLAEVDQTQIGGKTAEERQTVLRIVAKPGASSQRVILPVAIRGEGKGETKGGDSK